ncbi:leucine-rich repeat and WD repeat-containing protein 1-like [Ischnura elegans]|uniref:leucine-rich repeat and WD repeat-containing protein 1-like n=1 Tax=Ischnura elegans TaxID=197161 RepID=UPI001ED88687|nr:leucine-rich repeat and WD repeat-containing protein 1-like [Ischnura elegans]
MKRKLTYDSDENESGNIEECTQGLEYDNKFFEPVHFLRCHSKANDPADVKTQVWQCAFEPDMNSPGHTTNLLATCGGNSVCLVDAVTGKVSKKFYPEEASILLFSLAWTTLHPGRGRKCNILAVGGSKCYLQLILPTKNCSLLSPPQFLSPPSKNKAKDLISCLVFHPTMHGVLFCGGSSSSIAAWDISQCHPWSDSSEPKLPELLMSITAHSEVFSLSFSKTSNVLLAGCNSGLFGWSMNEVKWEKNVAPHQRKPKGIEFILPEVSEGNGETDDDETLVDSVVCIPGSSLVATKCALRGLIYLWNLAATIENMQVKSNKISESRKVKLSVTPVKCLRWSDTDDYFMAMGCSPDGQLLGCGDDEGGVWLYNIGRNVVEHKAKRVKRDADQPSMTEPHQRLLWPSTLADPEVQNARKVKRLEGHGGVIDHVTVGITQSGAIHLASVTSTNLVCIWKAFDDEEMVSGDKMLK